MFEIHECVGRPQLLLKLFSGNDVADVFDEDLQHAKRLRAQLEPDAIAIEFPCTDTKLKATTESDQRARRSDILG